MHGNFKSQKYRRGNVKKRRGTYQNTCKGQKVLLNTLKNFYYGI